MCFFITMAVPDDQANILRAASRRGLAIIPVDNRSILDALPARFRTFLLIRGQCSCSLYSDEDSPFFQPSPDAMRRKYRKKGWSDQKIERAVAQSLRVHQSRPHLRGLRDDVVELIRTLPPEVSRLALLVHWYNGDVEHERVVPIRSKHVHADQLHEAVPPTDCVVWIDRHG